MTSGEHWFHGKRRWFATTSSFFVAFLFGLAGAASADAPERLLQIPKDSVVTGAGAGELNIPMDTAADPNSGHLFVSEYGNDRISEFTAWGEFVKAWGWDVAPDGAPGDTVSDQFEICTTTCQAGSEGGGGGQFSNPVGLTLDDAGNVYVFDGAFSNNHRVQKFSSAGQFLLAFGGDVVAEGPNDSSNDELQEITVAASGGSFSLCFEGECTGDLPFNASAAEVQAALNALATISGPGGSVSVTGGPGDEAGSTPYSVAFGGRFAGDDVAALAAVDENLTGAAPCAEFATTCASVVTTSEGGAAEICKAGDVCQGGVIGNADGYFSNDSFNNFIAHNPVTDTLFVGDLDRIQEFDLDGNFKSKIVFEGQLGAFKGREVRALEVDSAGNLYMALGFPSSEVSLDNVHKLSPAGALLPPTFPVKAPFAIAVDPAGNVYANESKARVLGFEASGAPIEGMEPGDGFGAEGVAVFGLGTNLCSGSEPPGNLYVSYFSSSAKESFVNAYGSAPSGCESGPAEPPLIEEEYAVSVDTEGAVVKAKIDPNLRDDTTYFVQYGRADCPASDWTSGCQTTGPLKLSESTTDFTLTTKGVFLAGLEPATTYHYRFVAQSSGGGPVFGVGNSFRTFPRQTSPTPGCPANVHLRTDTAALLPDCRAYEMVSPLDKNNGDIRVPENPNQYPVSLFQAAAAGGGFTYSSSVAFGDVEGAPLVTQYLARRDSAQGWLSEPISPPRTRDVSQFLEPEFKQFSADLCQAWLRHDTDPPLTSDAVPGYLNLYRIDYCAGGGYEALTTEKPPKISCGLNLGVCPSNYLPLELQGTSADGAKAIYLAPDNLADAPVNNDDRGQLYFWSEGALRFACIRPNGNPSPEACSAGTYGSDKRTGRLSSLHNAISADGSLVYWSEGSKGGSEAPGSVDSRRLFVREHPDRDQSAIVAGKCTEPQKACTFAVSGPISTSDHSKFWAAADDGSRAFFTIKDGAQAGNLYLFDLAKAKAAKPGEPATTLVAEGVRGVMGASEDATRIYFVSTKDLDGEGAAQAEEPNLYFHDLETGSKAFIGALAARDLVVSGGAISPIHEAPFHRTSRVSADGSHAAFTSPAPLTGYDNRDAVSGERDTEVFLYDAEDDELICASCNPSGARPSGRQINLDGGFPPWIGARLPGWERALYASRALSQDGQRLFFESFDALVPRDTNGELDVYQWEALGKGDCDAGDSGFAPRNGGCVELISSGASPRESTFVDASTSGEDVFFTTLSSLVPQDYGLVDLYDARVGGGFPPPSAAKEPCQGEACQSPPARPERPAPASRTFEGAGNVKQTARKRCGKGKRRVVRKGKVRCVAKKQRKRAKSRNRGAGR